MEAGQQVTVDTLKAFLAAFNRHDIGEIMTFFTDDAVFDMPRGRHPWGTRAEGRDEVRGLLATRFEGLPDVHYGEDRHFVCDDRGVSEWLLTGTTPAGIRVAVRGCDLFEFVGGRISRKELVLEDRRVGGRPAGPLRAAGQRRHDTPHACDGEGSVVVRVVVRDAMGCDLVQEVRFPVQQRIVQPSGVACLPERRGGGHGEHSLQLLELLPHRGWDLTITLQVVQFDAVEDALEPLNVLDAEPAPRLGVCGAGLRRVHVGNRTFEAHIDRRLAAFADEVIQTYIHVNGAGLRSDYGLAIPGVPNSTFLRSAPIRYRGRVARRAGSSQRPARPVLVASPVLPPTL